MSGGSALFRRFPRLEGRIAWTPLGRFPTPVQELPVGGGHAWIKRDDLSGEEYGGNKVRKLEFLLADARQAGASRLVTAGAMGSHHALATAVYARRLGLEATLVLFPQPLTPHARRVLLTDVALGAELRFTRRMEFVPGALLAARWAHRREGAYAVAPGGSDARGTLGYVAAALELAEQVAAGEAPRPEVVHVAAGTLGTAAGLAIGLALAGLDTTVAATRITGRIVTNERTLARLVRGALALLEPGGVRLDPAEALRRVELRHGQIGAGYGQETEAGRRATSLFEEVGLRLDPTYTAKAAAELLADPPGPERPTLFWHTLSATEPALRAPEAELEARLPEPFRRWLRGD
ncbi:MAG TPA: pyridoxal-phosphate dependent enzyme [Longimicrobiales bacterium]|nr:pyridoxal-phosphate dependent enzyme [Longimicrobiales bacterium]